MAATTSETETPKTSRKLAGETLRPMTPTSL